MNDISGNVLGQHRGSGGAQRCYFTHPSTAIWNGLVQGYGERHTRLCRSTAWDTGVSQLDRAGWADVEGNAYPAEPELLGGQTDGAALRRMGIPTARMGWPWPAEGSPMPIGEGLGGLGATYIPDLMPCTRRILYAIIDTLARERSEVGL